MSSGGNFLDALLTGVKTVQGNGTPFPAETAINFIGATVADNPGQSRTDVTITATVAVSGSGFLHNTAGVLDAASRAVNLGTADVTGSLALTNIAQSGATLNNVIQWNGSQWVSGSASGLSIAGDVTGTLSGSTVVKVSDFMSNVVRLYGADPTGVADSSAAFQAAVNALAGTGVALFIPAGTYKIAAPITLPNNKPLTIVGTPNTVLKSTMAFSGADPLNCIFMGQQVSGAATTFASNNVIGARTISSTASLAVGSTVQLKATATYNNLRSGVYTVTAVSGVGPYTVTLDRPVLYQFVTGDAVTTLTSRPTGIRILGNGMVMAGTGDRYIELSAAVDCLIQDVIFDGRNYGGAVNVYAFSFDVGSYNCHAVRCEYDGGGTATNGMALESTESCSLIECRVRNTTSTGYQVMDCVSPLLVDLIASNCVTYGLQITGEFASAGCSDTRIVGGIFTNCGAGIQVDSASTRTAITQSAGSWNTSHGLHISTATYTSVVGGSYQFNGATGILVDVNSTGSRIADADVSNNTVKSLNLQTSCDVSNLSCIGSAGMGLYIAAAGTYHIRGCQIESSTAAFTAIELNNASAKVYLSDVHVSLDAINSYGILNAAGTLNASGLVLDGAQNSGNTGIYTANGATTRLGLGCDVQAAFGAPVTIVAGGVMSADQSGLIAANATAALTMNQLFSSEVESSGNAAGTVTITASILVPGMEWTFRNNNTGTSATTFMGVAVSIGQSARVRINSAGAGERVTIDQGTGTTFANVTAPATPLLGPIVYGSSGALKAIGTSGTSTTLAPADLEGFEGHCPKCGTDFALEWSNPKYGALTVCMRCLTDELGEKEWIKRK